MLLAANAAAAAEVPHARYHLTARPWSVLNVSRTAYLDAVEAACRFMVRHQDAHGAIIDPFLRREHQYSTPCFAFSGAVLLAADRGSDLADHVARALDHATASLAAGARGIPDQAGEFYLAPLAGALEIAGGMFAPERRAVWQRRMRTPLASVMENEALHRNSRRIYAMYGEWLRGRLSLVDRAGARECVERNWAQSQRERMLDDRWNLYQDRTSDPESHAAEAAARAHLLGLLAAGYNGRDAQEMAAALERSSSAALLMMDPSGQCPPNGRGEGHTVADALNLLAFERMAAREQPFRAGQYRRAAMLSFASLARWRRNDRPWDGSWYVTKNRFAPAQRVGYQPGAGYAASNAALMMHLAEAYLARAHELPEQPAPCEIGGYAVAADAKFASVFANAGGMQVVANLRGDSGAAAGANWTALGVVRFARAGWDSRLGPSDGVRDHSSGRGVSFAPTWIENGRWIHMADVPTRYQASFHVDFAHPLLVRCAIQYAPVRRAAGPAFRQDFIITPDAVLSALESSGPAQYAVTWPLPEDDGQPLETSITRYTASVRYPGGAGEQNFIALASSPMLGAEEDPQRGPWGWLRPVRSRSNLTLVYPRGPADPPAESVRTSFRQLPQGFSTILGRVTGNLYVGRTSAGGEGKSIDLDGDGRPEVIFSATCGFLLQLDAGKVAAVEVDREVHATIGEARLQLQPFDPVRIG
ncbi:MAG: hypothetical protein ACE15B_24065 [Bryobacteraceae bacterium]